MPFKHSSYTNILAVLRLGSRRRMYGWLLIVVMLLGAALIGLRVSQQSSAATAIVAKEVEDGTIAAPAVALNDASASAGRAVKFRAPTTSTPGPAANDKFGMSAPANLWQQRLADVGGPAHIKFRRVYMSSFTGGTGLVRESLADGMVPIISTKTGAYSWAQVASGAADADLRRMVVNMNAIPGPKFLSVHHEPMKDGTPADWSAMQRHVLPILKTANNVTVGVVANGFWWAGPKGGLTDAEIAAWIPRPVIDVSDVIASDTYQESTTSPDAGVKMTNMAAWARRVGGVKALGIGEWNGLTPQGVTNAMNVVKTEPLYKWALEWNSADTGIGLYLSGARLQAFKDGLATPDPT